jgi:hypothetical protein
VLTGRFQVREIAYGPGDIISAFWATFEQHCEGGPAALIGEVRVNASQRPTARVTLNGRQFRAGQTLTIGLDAQNPLGDPAADLYVGVVLPDGGTAVFFAGPGVLWGTVPLSAPAGFVRMPMPPSFEVSLPLFFQFTLPAGLTPGTYAVFAALVRSGALEDGRIDPGDVIDLHVATFAFSP